MIKNLLHKILGYPVEITFPDGTKETHIAHLTKDCTVRVVIWGKRHCYLQTDGIVRGLWPNDDTTWKPVIISKKKKICITQRMMSKPPAPYHNTGDRELDSKVNAIKPQKIDRSVMTRVSVKTFIDE